MTDQREVQVDRIGSENGTLLHLMVEGRPASFESRSLAGSPSPSDLAQLAQHV